MKRLKTSWDGNFENCDQGPQSHLGRNNSLPSDFNIEIKGDYFKVVKLFRNEIQDHKHKFYMVFFEVSTLRLGTPGFRAKKAMSPVVLPLPL
jgi:hypothetical protein